MPLDSPPAPTSAVQPKRRPWRGVALGAMLFLVPFVTALGVSQAKIGSAFFEEIVDSGALIGKGEVVRQTRNIGAFSGISLGRSSVGGAQLEVIVRPGGFHTVDVLTHRNLQSFVRTDVVNGTLHVSVSEAFEASRGVKVQVRSPRISSIAADGRRVIRVAQGMRGRNLNIVAQRGARVVLDRVGFQTIAADISRSARLTASGNVDILKLRVRSGEADVRKLDAKRVEVTAEDRAKVSVHATERLIVDADSRAHVTYEYDGGGGNLLSKVDSSATMLRVASTTSSNKR